MTSEKAYKLRELIEKSSESLSDQEALQGIELFAPWKVGEEYPEGEEYLEGEEQEEEMVNEEDNKIVFEEEKGLNPDS